MIYSFEMLEDIKKCEDDIEHFAEKHIKIKDENDDLKSLVLNEFQKQAIKDYKEKRVFAEIGCRREGKTTIAAIILLHQAIFANCSVSAIMAPTVMLSNNMLDLIFDMYQNLPAYMKYNIDITILNKSKIEFSNMCAIYSIGCNNMGLKGRTISNLYIDESEFMSTLHELQSILPCVLPSNNSRIFTFTSTRTSNFFREYT